MGAITAALVLALVQLGEGNSASRAEADVKPGPELHLLQIGEPLEVLLQSSDPPLAGFGPSRAFTATAGFSGTLFARTWSEELDLLIRIEDAMGKVLVEDRDEGPERGTAAYVGVEPGTRVVVRIAATRPDGAGSARLELVAAPETEETRAAEEEAEAALEEMQRLIVAGDNDSARALVEESIERLRATPGNDRSMCIQRALCAFGNSANPRGFTAAASSAWERALVQRELCLPDDHSLVVALRGTLARLALALGDLARARELQEKVLATHSFSLPDDHADLQRARRDLAITLREQGHLARAQELEEKVLAVYLLDLPDDHPDLQDAREGLAATVLLLGDLARARQLQETVLEVRSRTLPSGDRLLLRAKGNLAATLFALGDLRGARELFEEALASVARALPAENPLVLDARAGLASVLSTMGEWSRALELEQEVLEVYSRTRPSDDFRLQLARANLAGTLHSLGDNLAARELTEDVLRVLSRTLPDDHPTLQSVRDNLAAACLDLGDFSRARELEEKVLEILSRTLPDDHKDLQSARLRMGDLLAHTDDLSGAREFTEKAFEVLSRTLPDDHPTLQWARESLAIVLRELGDLSRAKDLEEHILEVELHLLPEDHIDVQTARWNLALTLRMSGDLEHARELQEQVLDVLSRKLPDDHADLIVARSNLAWTLASLGEREACLEVVLELSRRLRRTIVDRTLTLPPRELESWVARVRFLASAILSFASGAGRFGADHGLERESFAVVESLRGVALRSAELLRLAARDPEVVRLRAELGSASEELVRLSRSGAGREEIAVARGRRDELERALLRKAQGAPDRVALTLPDVPALSSLLGERDALVGFSRYEATTLEAAAPGSVRSTEAYCAFVLRSGGRLARVELGPGEAIERAVEDWHRAALGEQANEGSATRGVGVTAAADVESEERAAAALCGLVFEPLLPALTGVQRLILVLDDVLHAVPFDALPDGTGLLGERLRIETRATMWELLLEPRATERTTAVFFGGVDYEARPVPEGEVGRSDPAAPVPPSETRSTGAPGSFRAGIEGPAFFPLPGTASEVQAIAELHRQAFSSGSPPRALLGPSASRAALLSLAPEARFLHLATHGWFAPESVPSLADERPLDYRSGLGLAMTREEQVRGTSPLVLCGLALAGANLQQDAYGRVSGMITAEELSALDLSGCELAVLSACDTNVGVRRAGQGVASLQKALLMAGARTVVTSLWKVPDQATRELMADFYRRTWLERKPKAQALWEAKMRLRDARDEHGQPLHRTRDWAGWVLTGAPE